MLQIQWIADFSDYRIDYTRFSWMTLARAGKAEYEEITKDEAFRQGVSPNLLSALKEGISCFLVRLDGGTERFKIVVDNCDGFSGISERALIDCDLYFASAFLPSLYERREGITAYPWQEDYAMEHYRKKAAALIADHLPHFRKIRPFIPIQMQMWDTSAKGHHVLIRKLKRFVQKTRYGGWNILSPLIFRTFSERYDSVMELRREPMEYDIVITDSLWAWPGHRIKLHRTLRDLSHKGFRIVSRMNTMGLDPSVLEMGKEREENLRSIPELTRPVSFPVPYEKMLARSRLCVFATGKHWGWREVAFVTLACGIPTLMDRPVYQTYFGFDRFRMLYTENEWEEVEKRLEEVSDAAWTGWKEHNQRVFDATCSPEAVGAYLMGQIIADIGLLKK